MYPACHGSSGFAYSHHPRVSHVESNVIHLANFDSIRPQFNPVLMAWELYGLWILGFCRWHHHLRQYRVQ